MEAGMFSIWKIDHDTELRMPSRRFPPPWSVEELDACFIVKDSSGQKLGYFYYEEEPGRRSAAKLLTKDRALTLPLVTGNFRLAPL
jgi:hypothetical protein